MINFNIISFFEGSRLNGYVPEGGDKSGVTVASGFDIGQRSADEIDDAFTVQLADKLAPYCMLKGKSAIEELERMPLSVTQPEAEIINNYAHNQCLENLLDDWSNYTNLEFNALSDECQTVIASVAFQYGDLPTRCPMFWRQAVTQDWQAMLRNLWDFGDNFETRRRQEYMILKWGATK